MVMIIAMAMAMVTVTVMVMVMVTVMRWMVWVMKKRKSEGYYGGRLESMPFCWFLW